MQPESEYGRRAFSSFRALNEQGDAAERDQLFRSLAQLYASAFQHCDDEQIEQYDDVLCQLAAMVDSDARRYVAGLLAPLSRAPVNVVAILARDLIEIASPLLELSTALSDDDLVEIVVNGSEDHRAAIAGREHISPQVCAAILDHGTGASQARLAGNGGAGLAPVPALRVATAPNMVALAANSTTGRSDIDRTALGRRLFA